MVRMFFFLIGFFCLVFGFTDLILYFNLFTMGYSLFDFIRFIVCGPGILIFIGFVFVTITIFKEKRKKDEYGL